MNPYEILNRERESAEAKKRVAAYCRVSTDNEDQVNSFESQQRYFRRYIEEHPDWELYEIFADEGISGTNTKKRKAFNRMIEEAKSGAFDLIITKEISRFARNTLDSIYYTRELKRYGVGVIFMNDGIHTLDGDAELRLAILSSIAQEESRKTSERVKWGQKRRMEQGVVFGRDMVGYDVRGGKMYINEEGAKVVRLVFRKYVNEGKGIHVIARELREEGIPTMRYVKDWSDTVIRRMLRNEKYCGDLVQKKTYTPDFLSHEKKYNKGQEEFVIIRDHHEPIISREMFEEANRIMDSRSESFKGKSKYSNRYPFSGKIKCGICGSSFVARYKPRKDGSIYKAWRCYNAVRNGRLRKDRDGNEIGCSGFSLREEDLVHGMSLVCRSLKYDREKIIKNLLSVIRSVIAMDMGGNDAENLRAQIKEIEDKRGELLDLYMSGDISKDEFLRARRKYDDEITELQERIDGTDRRKALGDRRDVVSDDAEKAIGEIIGGVECDGEFYRHILDRIVVHNRDHFDVYLKSLPYKWSFSRVQATDPEGRTDDSSVPISVNAPLTEL